MRSKGEPSCWSRLAGNAHHRRGCRGRWGLGAGAGGHRRRGDGEPSRVRAGVGWRRGGADRRLVMPMLRCDVCKRSRPFLMHPRSPVPRRRRSRSSAPVGRVEAGRSARNRDLVGAGGTARNGRGTAMPSLGRVNQHATVPPELGIACRAKRSRCDGRPVAAVRAAGRAGPCGLLVRRPGKARARE